MRSILQANSPDILAQLASFEQDTASRETISQAVRSILAEVREKGDVALMELTERFDKARVGPDNLQVKMPELEEGLASLSREDIDNIRKAKAQVEFFHRITKPDNWSFTNGHGAEVGERFYPISAVGIYIPGGRVPLVSSVIMSVTLAKLAGNPRIVVCTPPLPDGSLSAGMRAALCICGVDEVYRVGGAQAIAAMAYGTQSIPKVDKVFGPGNAYVLEAKRQVFGEVGVDLLPGPSEVAILTDATCTPAWTAADLLAQAEHGTGKERIFLLAPSESAIAAIMAEVALQLPALTARERIEPIMDKRCVCITYENAQDAIRVINHIAPEHLELHVAEETIESFSSSITTAGAILQGHHTPTVLGDFTAGPSHTLPTGGAGRFLSGLRLTDFLRRTSVVRYKPEHLEAAAPVVRTFSRLEHLDAHGRSLEIRLTKP